MSIRVADSPDDDELAAILAAVSALLAEAGDATPPDAEPGSAWRAAAVLEAQGLLASRCARDAAWGRNARAERARRWSKGIV
ncbi:MAG: hypothetical protein H7Z42_19740 [Roseiflexaceae bacterium]|nr:hypothetical protein [Roseiflexaceae bacterium]